MSCLTDAAGADPSDRKGSTIMTNDQHSVGGVDSHKDTIHVAVITALGRPVDDREFPTTKAGYRRAVAWLIEHGPVRSVGIEGTSSYGVGIAAAVTGTYHLSALPAAGTSARPVLDNSKTPVLLAIVINAVLRVDVKYRYGPFNFRVMDGEPLLSYGEVDDIKTAVEKMKAVEDWADASSDSMLRTQAVSDIFHNRVIFMNTPDFRHILLKDDEGNPYKKNVMIGTVSFQEA